MLIVFDPPDDELSTAPLLGEGRGIDNAQVLAYGGSSGGGGVDRIERREGDNGTCRPAVSALGKGLYWLLACITAICGGQLRASTTGLYKN